MTNIEKSDTNAVALPALITKGLLSWHGFDGDITDVHGALHAELVIGNVAFGPDRFETPSAALVLEGATGLIIKGVSLHDGSFTIQFWALNPQKWILAQGIGEDGFGLHIGVGPLGMRCDYWGNDLIAPLGSGNEWTHWVMVHDIESNKKSTWRDGVCVAEMQSEPYRGRGDVTLGRHFSGVGFYTGSLDDVAIWNRALTADEVAFLYGGGKGPGYAGLAQP